MHAVALSAECFCCLVTCSDGAMPKIPDWTGTRLSDPMSHYYHLRQHLPARHQQTARSCCAGHLGAWPQPRPEGHSNTFTSELHGGFGVGLRHPPPPVMQCTCLLIAAAISNLPKPRVHLSIMRGKQLIDAVQSAICNATQNFHCGVVDNLDGDQAQMHDRKSGARRRQRLPAPAINIAFIAPVHSNEHSTWSSWLASAFMRKRSPVRERLLASRAVNFVEGLRALGGGRAVADIYGFFCCALQCFPHYLPTAAAIWHFNAPSFICTTPTEGCSATPTPLPGCPVLTAGTSPPQHWWSRPAAILFTTLLCATCCKGALPGARPCCCEHLVLEVNNLVNTTTCTQKGQLSQGTAAAAWLLCSMCAVAPQHCWCSMPMVLWHGL